MKTFDGYRRGVNFGGWFSQREYTKEYFDSFIREEDVERVAEWGVDHVRVPVDYNVFENEDGSYKEDGFEYIERVIGWCGKYGINMVLDLHKTAGYSFDKGEQECGFFDSAELQERFFRLWEQFAVRYGKYSGRMAFELLNEVTDKEYSASWNRIVAECIRRIRVHCPSISILVGSYWYNSHESLVDLDMPYDENVVYNFHCYSPIEFTHQSAYWVENMPSDFHLDYPATAGEYRRAVEQYAPGVFIRRKDSDDTVYNAQYFIDMFAGAVKIAEERGVALYCGEYGVIDQADPEAALRWYADINAAFEHYGIGRAAWSYRAVDFGLSDEHMAPVLERILKYL